jgi:hypothetical protein
LSGHDGPISLHLGHTSRVGCRVGVLVLEVETG